jgi:four helix bundle protein
MEEKSFFIETLKLRTKSIALRGIKVFQALPKTDEAKIIGKQFLRSITSLAANYRATCRARSQAEYFSKLSITVEEADETLFWIEIMIESNIFTKEKLQDLFQETQEIVKILSKARKNTK